jgi:hypothetical protein
MSILTLRTKTPVHSALLTTSPDREQLTHWSLGSLIATAVTKLWCFDIMAYGICGRLNLFRQSIKVESNEAVA